MVWLKEDLVDSWKKIWWIVRRRYGSWLEEGLVDNWMKVW
jgi:hypothetical protein